MPMYEYQPDDKELEALRSAESLLDNAFAARAASFVAAGDKLVCAIGAFRGLSSVFDGLPAALSNDELRAGAATLEEVVHDCAAIHDLIPDQIGDMDELYAANANIGAARAAMFPSISLTGSAGRISNSLSGLVDDGRKTWGLTGSLLAPIFDMGRTRAGVEVAQASRDIAVAQYEKALQSAFREVSDALVSRQTYGEQAQAQQAQADAENDRLRLSALRYRSGVASQLDLLDAQRSLFTAQQALIQAQLARQQANITLFKTLGGGWDRDTATMVPAAAATAASGPAS